MRRLNLLPISIAILLLFSVPSCYGDEYTGLRHEMISKDIKGRGISNPSVLRAMGKVPRHLLINESYRPYAYSDRPLPIAEGQTISQPYVVALMTEKLELKPAEKVLEIGTGSGYQAAVLAEITKEVYTIEIREGLAISAEKKLRQLGYNNIAFKVGDGYYGWEEHAPYDAIIITASTNHIPPPLIRQLKVGGRLIVPLGPTVFHQTLTLVKKLDDEQLEVRLLGGVAFVPMTGKVQEN